RVVLGDQHANRDAHALRSRSDGRRPHVQVPRGVRLPISGTPSYNTPRFSIPVKTTKRNATIRERQTVPQLAAIAPNDNVIRLQTLCVVSSRTGGTALLPISVPRHGLGPRPG